MALKRTLDSLDGVDETTAKLYTEKDGKFVLDVEGDDRIDEFRENNRALHSQVTQLTESLAEQKTAMEQLRDQLQGKEKEVETVKQTEAERIAALEERARKADESAAQARQQARTASLSDTLGKLGAANGVQDTALNRFSQVHSGAFAFDDEGQPFVAGDGGKPRLSEENPGQRMTPEEYVRSTLQAETFWLKPSTGDGAPGDGGTGGPARKISKAEAEKNWATYEKDILAGKIEVEAE